MREFLKNGFLVTKGRDRLVNRRKAEPLSPI